MVDITEYIGRIMNGSRMWVIATIVPNWLLIMVRRDSSATSPIHTSTSLITPCCCSITFQAEDVLVVSTGKPATAVSNFALKRTLDVVEADPAPSGGVTLEGDDGPECKKAKAEPPLEEEEDAPPAM